MKIAIDASRAFLKNPTGIEEYSYQVIKHLRPFLKKEKVVLLVHPLSQKIDFKLPDNWRVKKIPLTYFWTQLGLSGEMLFHPVDLLFVPAHTLPLIRPKKTLVTVHGLEYEHNHQSYSFWARHLHRFFIKNSCRWADKIIAVSKKTQEDLRQFYRVPKNKIKVIYNGYQSTKKTVTLTKEKKDKFILFIGRLEERKNIEGIMRTFEWLREKYNYQGKLILVGQPGYGYEKIKQVKNKLKHRRYIQELGYISKKKKWALLSQAQLLMFPSLSEGFGIPILEAQYLGTPVITSNFAPLNEVAGDEKILVNPKNYPAMARLANQIIKDKNFSQQIIQRGKENVKRFSWEKCAQMTAEEIKKLGKI